MSIITCHPKLTKLKFQWGEFSKLVPSILTIKSVSSPSTYLIYDKKQRTKMHHLRSQVPTTKYRDKIQLNRWYKQIEKGDFVYLAKQHQTSIKQSTIKHKPSIKQASTKHQNAHRTRTDHTPGTEPWVGHAQNGQQEHVD